MLPLERKRSTIKAMITNGATETRAEAERLHHGVTDELSATTATGSSCVLVNVSVKAKKKSFQPNMRQNSPATAMPGRELGRITRTNAPIGLQPSIMAVVFAFVFFVGLALLIPHVRPKARIVIALVLMTYATYVIVELIFARVDDSGISDTETVD